MRIILLISLLCLNYLFAGAKIKLPPILDNHMVLQQQTEVKLWGEATPNKKVVINVGWDKKKKYVTQTDSLGKWEITVSTPKAGGPYEIKISDGDLLVLKDILIGEVWYCSGQSNMEMPMKGFGGQPVENSKKIIEEAREEIPIRMFTVAHHISKLPVDTLNGEWMLNTSDAVMNTSATAYFFARKIQAELNIPVGIIICAWSGSGIQPWMSREALLPFRDIVNLKYLDNLKNQQIRGEREAACCMRYGMVNPLLNCKFRGMLWYQGETNHKDGRMYARMLPAFVKDMRQSFDCGEFPFLYVQIAPHNYDGAELQLSAELREAQMKSMKEIPNSGMAVLMDIPGHPACIHPAKKCEVGERLAAWALAKTYNKEGIAFSGPIYRSVSFIGKMAVVDFDYAEDGLKSNNKKIAGFELAGKDKVFHQAEAIIGPDGQTVLVTSEHVQSPIAVRYAFRNYIVGELFGANGLPASSFRSDNW